MPDASRGSGENTFVAGHVRIQRLEARTAPIIWPEFAEAAAPARTRFVAGHVAAATASSEPPSS